MKREEDDRPVWDPFGLINGEDSRPVWVIWAPFIILAFVAGAAWLHALFS